LQKFLITIIESWFFFSGFPGIYPFRVLNPNFLTGSISGTGWTGSISSLTGVGPAFVDGFKGVLVSSEF
jgi:hypothetical protein